jgi:hypothetical protein
MLQSPPGIEATLPKGVYLCLQVAFNKNPHDASLLPAFRLLLQSTLDALVFDSAEALLAGKPCSGPRQLVYRKSGYEPGYSSPKPKADVAGTFCAPPIRG